MENENSALGSPQPQLVNHDNVPPAFPEDDEVQRLNGGNAKWTLEEMIDELIAVHLRLGMENIDLKFENDQMKEKQKAKADTTKALQAQNAHLIQLNAVLEAINKKQLGMIYNLEKEKEDLRHFNTVEKNALECEVTIVNKVNVFLEAENKKHLEKISALEKQQQASQQARDKEKKTPEPQVAEMRQNKYVRPHFHKALETIDSKNNGKSPPFITSHSDSSEDWP